MGKRRGRARKHFALFFVVLTVVLAFGLGGMMVYSNYLKNKVSENRVIAENNDSLGGAAAAATEQAEETVTWARPETEEVVTSEPQEEQDVDEQLYEAALELGQKAKIVRK